VTTAQLKARATVVRCGRIAEEEMRRADRARAPLQVQCALARAAAYAAIAVRAAPAAAALRDVA
jgi:hypothetical protein